MNLLMKITGGKREVLVDRSQLCDVLDIMELDCDIRSDAIIVGNCGWAKAPDCYFVYVKWVSNAKWYNCLHAFHSKGIVLLPETTGC